MSGNTRASIFDAEDTPVDVFSFEPKTAPVQDAPSKEKVREVSEAANFRSREPVRPQPTAAAMPRQRRQYRTGRNVQFNVKVSQDTLDGFYRVADAQGWVLGEVLEQALAALDRELNAKA